MIVDISLWDLDGCEQTVESLRASIDEGLDDWARVEGLRWKLWIEDRQNHRWGAVMLWDPDRPAGQALPPNQAAQVIGRPADHRMRFEVAGSIGILGEETVT
jgi:hypothetical protein